MSSQSEYIPETEADKKSTNERLFGLKEVVPESLTTSKAVKREHVTNHIKWAGPYMLGMTLGNSPVDSITNCLARKNGTDKFYVIKILKLQDNTLDDQQGKILLHTEYTLLSFLEGESGVVQQHGLFRDEAKDSNGQTITRLCLVLDCYVPHDFSPEYCHLSNLQYYVVSVKRLSENEAVRIFLNVLLIVQRLHKKNVVHRDLKLGNIIMNKSTGEISIANFCLGKQLTTESELLIDQRGSPAYISPDVIKGEPYCGKPSDMWALGVIFYTMLFGQFPFYDPCPSELFRKIKACDYTISDKTSVTPTSLEIIENLLILNPRVRLTCDQVLDKLFIASTPIEQPLQVVPEFPESSEPNTSKSSSDGGRLGKYGRPGSRLPVSQVPEEAKVLTYRDLKKIYNVYQSKDCNIKKLIKRL